MRTLFTLTVCLLATMPPAWAASAYLQPGQVFATDAPSIVVVVAYGEDGKAIAQGSGVVIAKDTVVSNCHVIEKANTAGVLYQKKRFTATLRYEDVERDLCSFTVKGLSAPPVQLGSTSQLKVGDAAYAIGAPEGLELTLSGGLISSLRKIPGGVVLQMTTPISPGSSGGGLFDSEGRLIGITSYYMAKGEQLNFALPVEWVRDLPKHGKLASMNSERVARATKASRNPSLKDGERALAAGDYAAALVILKPLATQGNAVAQGNLGWMYELGHGVPQDYAQAVMWYRKAATQGDAEAQDNLGLIYQNGQGVLQDYAQAAAWYRKAAIQGDVGAQTSLGLMYTDGQGVPKDYAQAVAWFRKAAAQGFAFAQDFLGVAYANGQGVPQDYAQAVAWFRKAAIQGLDDAQTYLGSMYYLGQGVPKDYVQAAAWYRKAAIQGDVGAQTYLGSMYADGQGVPQDYAQALAWYRKAAEYGNAQAQHALGSMYYFGQGVPQDYAQAVAWFRKAAERGNRRAQGALGFMYADGQGVPQDYVVAYALLNLSASLDSSSDNPAATSRSKLMALMTPAQVAAGQALTRRMQSIGPIKALDEYLNGGAR